MLEEIGMCALSAIEGVFSVLFGFLPRSVGIGVCMEEKHQLWFNGNDCKSGLQGTLAALRAEPTYMPCHSPTIVEAVAVMRT